MKTLFPTLFLTYLAGTQVPAIDTLQSARSGDDLAIAWAPPVLPVDGYRVYLARDVRCETTQLLYDGQSPAFTHVGAFLDPQAALYRVAAYIGPDEGPYTTPVYKYPLHLVREPAPGCSCDMYSLPFDTGVSSSLELCPYFNPSGTPVPHVARLNPVSELLVTQLCGTTKKAFDVVPGEGYALDTTVTGSADVMVWGHGHPEWRDTLLTAATPGISGSHPHLLSLPYDHAYADLSQVSEDISGALYVKVWDPALDIVVGLSRATISDAWSGTNVALSNRPSGAVFVAVESVPVTWEPKRLCGTPCPVPLPRIPTLRAAKAGDDVALRWTPWLLASGGYELFRVNDKTAIPGVLATLPHLAVAGAEPVFPVIDLGAVLSVDSLYYQLVGRCANGAQGEL